MKETKAKPHMANPQPETKTKPHAGTKLPFVNPNPSSTFEPPLSFEMASNPTKSSKRKQGECSQAFSIGWIRGSLMKITRLTSRSSFWNVRIPKFLDLEWFYQ